MDLEKNIYLHTYSIYKNLHIYVYIIFFLVWERFKYGINCKILWFQIKEKREIISYLGAFLDVLVPTICCDICVSFDYHGLLLYGPLNCFVK